MTMATTGSVTLLGQGFRQTASKWGVLGLLYAVNLLITLPLALIFRSALSNLVGESPAIDELFPDFMYMIYNDITRVHGDAIAVFRRMFIPVILVSVPIHAILGVGLARVMETDGSVREFFGGIVSFWGRAVRLLLIYLLIMVVLSVVAGFISAVIFAGITDGNATEDAYVLGGIIVGLIFALVLTVIILGSEYSRILTVTQNRLSMFRSAWDGIVLVFRHPVRMAGLHGTIFVALLFVTGLYWLIEGVVGMTSMAGVLLMLVVQQAFVVYRLFTRMWNTSNGVRLAGIIARSSRPSFVQAPSVHDRQTVYREPPIKETDDSAKKGRTGRRPGILRTSVLPFS